VESDKFAGFMQRYNTDVGAKYWIYHQEKIWEWFAELGYRYQSEHRVTGERAKSSLIRSYTEANRQWNERVSSRLWLEYLPNLTNSDAWLLNGEFSSSFLLNSIFAVKIAYLSKYQNRPTSPKKTDATYTTSLVAKF
jgi:putative salt-induced outer membrane protein